MLIMPAIDILDGKCVRLIRGNYEEVKIYEKNPVKVAKKFIEAGAQILHVVDLDGARIGKPVNKNLIIKLAKLSKIQIGGGIRDLKTASAYLKNDVERIIIGTAAITNFDLLKNLINKFGSERVVVSLDIKQAKIATNGWKNLDEKYAGKSIKNILKKLKDLEIRFIMVTDINKDGTLAGPNFDLIKNFDKEGFNFIAAGGVSSMKDLENLKKMNIYGAIVGKAIYEKKIDLKKLLVTSKLMGNNSVSNLAKRIIPCMDIANGRVVKGIKFKNLKDAGDPIGLAKYYNKNSADELVFLDINASVENRRTLYELVKKIAENINIPFTVGGGIKSIKDIKMLLNSGADKVAISTAAVLNPGLIKEAARNFGSQCIVISLDCKKNNNSWKIYIKGGREKTNIDAISFAKKMEKLGAGELLVNSIDRDGSKKGYDIDLLRKISEAVNIPVIASSGAGSKEDFLKVLIEGKVDAILAASLFHYGTIKIPELKNYLGKNNIAIRI